MSDKIERVGDTSTVPCPNPDCPCVYPMELVEIRYEQPFPAPDEAAALAKIYLCNMCGQYARKGQS